MYKQLQTFGPFAGIVDSLPAPNKPTNAFDDLVNMLCRHGRLQSRPAFATFGNPPDGSKVRLIQSFVDVLGYTHTLVVTNVHAYFVTSGATYNALTNLTQLSTGLPCSRAVINNKVYYSNGSTKLAYADGSSAIQVAGDTPGGCRFLGVLANHLVQVNTTEPAIYLSGAIRYGNRFRWSVNGDPDDWTSAGSGATDLLDCPNEFTGFSTNGRNGYIYHPEGLSVAFPTGDGSDPFAIEPYSSALQGVGVAYPYTLDTYGNLSMFVGKSDIYTFNGVELTPVGQAAKKKIFVDIAAASGDIVIGKFIANAGIGYDMLSYWLNIPGPDVTWIYMLDSNTWQRITSSFGSITWIGPAVIA